MDVLIFFFVGGGVVSWICDFVVLEMFQKFFVEGMDFVEEMVSYLDGLGCDDFKFFDCVGVLFYVIESMKLIICLMQVVFWLLVQWVVVEGEMSLDDVFDNKYCFGFDCMIDDLWLEGEILFQILFVFVVCLCVFYV